MCCSGKCPWERNDWNNGGTTCSKPHYATCPESDDYDEEEETSEPDEAPESDDPEDTEKKYTEGD